MGSVHDSFWTHAGDIDLLRQITRLTFVAQYEADVLEQFRSEVGLVVVAALRGERVEREESDMY